MPKSMAELRTLWLAKLKASSLTLDHAEELKMQLFNAEQVKARYPVLPLALGGFRIPYFDLRGKPSKFYRFRYLEEPARTGFAVLTEQKTLRYGQPKDTLNELYLPPWVPWESVAANPSLPIVITEGELKAACACVFNLACMGLGGVWCFGSKERGVELLPQFDLFAWAGRQVFVVFDSDAATNPLVVMAENVLCRRLAHLGAFPHVVRLPNLLDLKKTGLDDYLTYHESAEPLKHLLEQAPGFLEYQELHKLNEEVTYVRNPGMILEFESKQRMSVEMFIRHSYANRFMIKIMDSSSGKPKTQRVSAPRQWVEWNGRNSVQELTYVPGDSSITVNGKFNTWSGWGCEPKSGDIRPWRDLVDVFFAEEMEVREWFEQWFAYPLQHPGTKLMSAIVLWSRTQGNGKSTVGETMRYIYGNNYVHIDNTQLENSFNEWADSKQFVMGDEITGDDRRSYADKLKNLVTQTQVFVNKKHLPTYTIPDCINYYFTSNHPDVIQLDESDRRFFIHQVPDPPLGNEFFDDYYKWLEKSDGASHLFNYLLRLDLSNFNPNAPPPRTQSKANMEMLAMSDLDLWARSLRDQPDSVTVLGNVLDQKKLYTAEELRTFYDPEQRTRTTANGVSRALTKAGLRQAFRGVPITVQAESVGRKPITKRLWVIRDRERLISTEISPREIAAIYCAERGSIVAPKHARKQEKTE